ncbi:MAG: 50S ribosomal protein L32 [Deltaproteobacteria bacterium]|jgi:large subunit ribosomal protein L32|nr:50S ribosomal protein L32 [Deltaproteobacteria bacterium]
MPNPKRRGSKCRRDKRRTHKKLTDPARSNCSQCKQVKRPHTVCPNCGSYNGREVIAKS